MTHRASHVFHVIVLLIGAAGLTIALAQLGWEGVERAVIGTGAWFLVIAFCDVLSAGCDAYAIQGFLGPEQRISYRAVFAAQVSGMAVNRLTPGNSLGEPVKVTMLTTQGVPTSSAVSAIVMFNLVTAYVGVTSLVIGVPLTTLFLDLPSRVVFVVWLATGVLVLLTLVAAVIVKRGAVSTIVDAVAGLRFIKPERAARWRAKIIEIDARLRELGGNAKAPGRGRGLASLIMSRLLSWCGTLAVLHAANIPLEPKLIVATLSVGVIVTWASSIVPLGLGIADGANYVLYGLLGASQDAGLLFTMIQRLRTVVVALIGLGVMALAHAAHRGAFAREAAT